MSETLTVVQLNERVRSILNSSEGVRDVWVAGEISNMTKHSSGHYYFTLKDSGSEIRCSLFKSVRARVNFEPNENMKVVVFGRTDIYVQRGQYQFIVDTMRASGIGDLYVQFDELKKKLEKEGLFDPERKRPIPRFPRTVGVVTSPTGAAIHDILTVSGRRFPANILLYPALVQGDGASASIVKGIELLNKADVDVMIVGRGGGSIEDLWAFNTEPVARAIALSKVPVISAVGHESDYTIADMVADLRAPTPSAAAEIALADKMEETRHIDSLGLRLSRSLRLTVETLKNRFKVLDARLSPRRAKDMVNIRFNELNEMMMRADNSLIRMTESLKGRVELADARLSPKQAKGSVDQYILRLNDNADALDSTIQRKIADLRKDVKTMEMRLDGLNPTSVIGRGYSLIRDNDGRTLTSVTNVKKDTDVNIVMKDGSAKARIKEVMKNE